MRNEVLVSLQGVTKEYQSGPRVIQALRGIDLVIEPGEWISIVGPSGCGKSTLLNLLSGIDRPSTGTVTIAGTEISAQNEEQLARWRGETIGIVFQFFQLLPTLTALENVLLPIELNGHRQPREYAMQLLARVGVDHLAGHLPNELSGGEQQRVAIARALANDPPILLADEPTGNLDSAAGQRVLRLLEETWQLGKMLILVTHDQAVAHRASRMIEMRDGNIVGDTRLRDRVVAVPPEQPLEHLNGNRGETYLERTPR